MSWVSFFIAFPFFIIFAIFGTVIYLLYLNQKEKAEPENSALLDSSSMRQYCRGHGLLSVSEEVTGSEKTMFICYPRDFNPAKLINESKRLNRDIIIKPIVLFVRNDLIDRPRKSDHKNFIKVYPPRPEDISADLKGTTEGKIIEERIAKANVIRDSEMINRSEAENLRSMAMDTKGLNIYKTILNLKGAEIKELINSNPNQNPPQNQ